MRTIRFSLLLLAFGIANPLAALADTSVCRQFADKAREQALSIIHDQQNPFSKKHAELVRLFEQSVDIETISHKVAGKYWQAASPEAQKKFDAAYKVYISDYYINGFNEDDLKTILTMEFSSFDEEAPGKYLVDATITQSDDDPIHVNFNLEENKGTCRIEDFSVEGVGMLASQSEEIQLIGSKGGLNQIMEKLNSRPKAYHQ